MMCECCRDSYKVEVNCLLLYIAAWWVRVESEYNITAIAILGSSLIPRRGLRSSCTAGRAGNTAGRAGYTAARARAGYTAARLSTYLYMHKARNVQEMRCKTLHITPILYIQIFGAEVMMY